MCPARDEEVDGTCLFVCRELVSTKIAQSKIQDFLLDARLSRLFINSIIGLVIGLRINRKVFQVVPK